MVPGLRHSSWSSLSHFSTRASFRLIAVAAIILTVSGLVFHPRAHEPIVTRLNDSSTVGAPQSSQAQWSSSASVSSPFGHEHLDITARQTMLQDVRSLRKHIQQTGFLPGHIARQLDEASLLRLEHCLRHNDCGPGETTVVLLADSDFSISQHYITGGESVWALSVVEGLKAHNYTLLYPLSPAEVDHYNQVLGYRIPIIIWKSEFLDRCIQGGNGTSRQEVQRRDRSRSSANGSSAERGQSRTTLESGRQEHAPIYRRAGAEDEGELQGCMQTEAYPRGVEMWKSFVFHFWSDSRSPLGRGWTLAPEWFGAKWSQEAEWSGEKDEWLRAGQEGVNRYIGYSVEERCRAFPLTPHDQREHRAMVLGKLAEYYDEDHNLFAGSFGPVAASPVLAAHEFRFVSTARADAQTPLPEGIQPLGETHGDEWYAELGKSRVLVGIGWPATSPSPYDALCLGVPFVNPIMYRDEADPANRTRWHTQHDALRDLDPPYVYHVMRGDTDGLRRAIEAAYEAPIDRFVPERMTSEQVSRRMGQLVRGDWREMARQVVNATYVDGEYPWLL